MPLNYSNPICVVVLCLLVSAVQSACSNTRSSFQKLDTNYDEDTDAVGDTDADTDADNDTETDTDSETSNEIAKDTHTETDTDSETSNEMATDTHTETDTDSETSNEIAKDTHTDTDIDTGSDTDVGCVYRGRTYEVGESFSVGDACNSCHCIVEDDGREELFCGYADCEDFCDRDEAACLSNSLCAPNIGRLVNKEQGCRGEYVYLGCDMAGTSCSDATGYGRHGDDCYWFTGCAPLIDHLPFDERGDDALTVCGIEDRDYPLCDPLDTDPVNHTNVGKVDCSAVWDGWRGCSGSGCTVCNELVSDYPNYFIEHPNCLPNANCNGSYALCSHNCPAPTLEMSPQTVAPVQ